MDDEQKSPASCILYAVAELIVLAGILPWVCAFALGYPLSAAAALVASAFVIEYGAATVGLALGLPPLYVLFTVCSVALGVTLFLFGILDAAGGKSARVQAFLSRSAERGRQSQLLSKYGIYGLVPCVITLGFFACPPIAGILGWKRDRSILMIMAGYIGISVATILLTLGIFSFFKGSAP